MRTIDRYLLRQFVQVYCICLISLTGLYVIIDAFGNLDEFIGYAEKQGGLLNVMGKYYAFRSIAFFDRVSGILALIAAMFTVTWIQRHQELTALSAAGIRTGRIIMPVILAASSVSLLAAANRELVIPRIRDVLSRNAQDLLGENGRDLQPRYDSATEILLRGAKIFANRQRIEKPSFLLPAGLDEFGKHLVAENAFYQPRLADRPSGFLLVGVTEPKALCQQRSLRIGDQPVVLTPVENSWLKSNECFVVSEMTYEMLEGGSNWRSFASTAELIRGLRSPSLEFGADVPVAVHSRLVQPLLDVNLLFLGLPLVLTRRSRNVFFAIGLCVLIALGFMGTVIICQYLGNSYWLSPVLAAWLPLLIAIPVALAMADPLVE